MLANYTIRARCWAFHPTGFYEREGEITFYIYYIKNFCKSQIISSYTFYTICGILLFHLEDFYTIQDVRHIFS